MLSEKVMFTLSLSGIYMLHNLELDFEGFEPQGTARGTMGGGQGPQSTPTPAAVTLNGRSRLEVNSTGP